MAAAAIMAAMGSRRSTYQPLAETTVTTAPSTYGPRVEFSPRSSVDMGQLGVRCATSDEMEETHDCSSRIARHLAADRARSLRPAAGEGLESASSEEEAERRAKSSRLARLAARLIGKPSPAKEVLKAEAERSAAASAEYGPHYTNCTDISPQDSHSLRSANFHHENFGELEAYAAGHGRRVELSAVEVVCGREKVLAWLEELDGFGTWEMVDPEEVSLDGVEANLVLEDGGRGSGDIRLYEGC